MNVLTSSVSVLKNLSFFILFLLFNRTIEYFPPQNSPLNIQIQNMVLRAGYHDSTKKRVVEARLAQSAGLY